VDKMAKLYKISLLNGNELSEYKFGEVVNYVYDNNYQFEPNAELWGLDKVIEETGSAEIFNPETDETIAAVSFDE